VDTNATYLGKTLNNIGIEVRQIHSISDNKEAILDAFATAQDCGTVDERQQLLALDLNAIEKKIPILIAIRTCMD